MAKSGSVVGNVADGFVLFVRPFGLVVRCFVTAAWKLSCRGCRLEMFVWIYSFVVVHMRPFLFFVHSNDHCTSVWSLISKEISAA